jgi:hypothetical protein
LTLGVGGEGGEIGAAVRGAERGMIDLDSKHWLCSKLLNDSGDCQVVIYIGEDQF